MRIRRVLLLLFINVLLISLTYADEQIEVNNNEEKKIVEFLEEEGDRSRELRLLELELQKTSILLKKQQMVSEIEKISNVSISTQAPDSDEEQQETRIDMKLLSVLMTSKDSLIVINVNGEQVKARLEDEVYKGYVVKKIYQRGVEIQYPDGSLREIKLQGT